MGHLFAIVFLDTSTADNYLVVFPCALRGSVFCRCDVVGLFGPCLRRLVRKKQDTRADRAMRLYLIMIACIIVFDNDCVHLDSVTDAACLYPISTTGI